MVSNPTDSVFTRKLLWGYVTAVYLIIDSIFIVLAIRFSAYKHIGKRLVMLTIMFAVTFSIRSVIIMLRAVWFGQFFYESSFWLDIVYYIVLEVSPIFAMLLLFDKV